MTYYHHIPIMIATQNAQRAASVGTGEMSGDIGSALAVVGIAVVVSVIICVIIDRWI